MTHGSSQRGFTLIELLVVVIIIGILAAIALPQYQKAVMKSRFASLKPIAKSVKDAQEMYYHRNGQYAGQSELADLDVGIPQEASIDISAEGDHQYIRANHTGLPHNSYTAYLDRSSNFAGNIYCEAYTGDVNAEQLCVAEGGTAGPTNGSYTLYLLSGNSTGSFARGLQPTQTSVPCPHRSGSNCDIYTLENGHILEFRDDGEWNGKKSICAFEYENSNEVAGGCYLDGECLEASCGFVNLCDTWPMLDICNE